MKTRLASSCFITVALAGVALVNGCTQQTASNAPAYITTSSAPPAIVTPVAPPAFVPVETVAEARPAAPVVPAEVPVPSLIIINTNAPIAPAEPVLPANLRISKPLNEIIRLAQSGVEETVILTYITNSPAIFTLGAEEIVYLNDLGISSSVITAMMHRDQTLRATYANAANPPTPTTATAAPVAAAPTYLNPPQATPAPEAPPVYVSNDYFYDSLSPYGTWVEIDGYGRCWRPTVAITSSTWQPYRDRGRWVHTDSGWYWMSDYSWGSVAFHYGRWFSHPRWGWCWWPDTVWAPSWVTWRYDNDHCGWAPLPPHSYYRPGAGFYYRDRAVSIGFDFGLHVGAFTFVSWNRFCDPRPYQYYLPRARSVAIYNQTTVINNVGIGNNNTVINRGIDKDRVRERSRTEVRTVSLREERPTGASPRSDRFERDGRTLVVSRPALPLSPASAPSPISAERNNWRDPSSRPNESRPGTLPNQPAVNRPSRDDREPRRDIGRAPEIENRTPIRPGTPNNNSPAAPAVVTTPSPSTPVTPRESSIPTRPEIRPDRERGVRQPEVVTPPSRPSSTAVIRTPEATPAPTPARTPTPIFSRPVVVETPAYTPTRPIAPTPQPQPTAPASAPSYRPAPARNPNNLATENSPWVQPNQPAPTYNRPNVEPRREERFNRNDVIDRSSRSRSEERAPAPVFTTPTPRVSPPAVVAPAPTPVQRPVFTPPAAPAPRVEAQPIQPRTEVSRPESRATANPDSGRPSRNR
jgi:hypothetical protein